MFICPYKTLNPTNTRESQNYENKKLRSYTVDLYYYVSHGHVLLAKTGIEAVESDIEAEKEVHMKNIYKQDKFKVNNP